MLKHLRMLRMPYSVNHVIGGGLGNTNRQIVNACGIIKRNLAGFDDDNAHFLRKQRQKLKQLSKRLQDEKDMINSTLDRVTDEIGRLNSETKKQLNEAGSKRNRKTRQNEYGQGQFTGASGERLTRGSKDVSYEQDPTKKNKGK